MLASTASPPLREIATVLMKVSQNLYAETLLKALGAARGGLGTAEGGRVAVRTTLDAGAFRATRYVMADGSGLSRYNYVTAGDADERARADVQGSAASRRLRRDAADRRQGRHDRDADASARAPKGTPSRRPGRSPTCASLSGFVRTRDGEMLVFSILAQRLRHPRGDGQLDRRPRRRDPGELHAASRSH